MAKKITTDAPRAGHNAYLARAVQALEDRVAKLEDIIARQMVAAKRLRDLQGEGREYMAGTYHRRDGTVYDKVAAKGTPNAAAPPSTAAPKPDDPPGALSPAKQR